MPKGRVDPAVRLWAKVEKTDTCWLWTGQLVRGYGRIGTPDGEKRVHRLAWELLRGPIPEGLVLDDICRVRNCVNPDHLRVVTIGENVLLGVGISAINARKKRCQHGHDLAERPDGSRFCRTCAAQRARDRRQPKPCIRCGGPKERGRGARQCRGCSGVVVMPDAHRVTLGKVAWPELVSA